MKTLALIVSFFSVMAIGGIAKAETIVWQEGRLTYTLTIPEPIFIVPEFRGYGHDVPGQIWPGPLPGYPYRGGLYDPIAPTLNIWDPCDSDPRC